jgi:hypothetical protein
MSEARTSSVQACGAGLKGPPRAESRSRTSPRTSSSGGTTRETVVMRYADVMARSTSAKGRRGPGLGRRSRQRVSRSSATRRRCKRVVVNWRASRPAVRRGARSLRPGTCEPLSRRRSVGPGARDALELVVLLPLKEEDVRLGLVDHEVLPAGTARHDISSIGESRKAQTRASAGCRALATPPRSPGGPLAGT